MTELNQWEQQELDSFKQGIQTMIDQDGIIDYKKLLVAKAQLLLKYAQKTKKLPTMDLRRPLCRKKFPKRPSNLISPEKGREAIFFAVLLHRRFRVRQQVRKGRYRYTKSTGDLCLRSPHHNELCRGPRKRINCDGCAALYAPTW